MVHCAHWLGSGRIPAKGAGPLLRLADRPAREERGGRAIANHVRRPTRRRSTMFRRINEAESPTGYRARVKPCPQEGTAVSVGDHYTGTPCHLHIANRMDRSLVHLCRRTRDPRGRCAPRRTGRVHDDARRRTRAVGESYQAAIASRSGRTRTGARTSARHPASPSVHAGQARPTVLDVSTGGGDTPQLLALVVGPRGAAGGRAQEAATVTERPSENPQATPPGRALGREPRSRAGAAARPRHDRPQRR